MRDPPRRRKRLKLIKKTMIFIFVWIIESKDAVVVFEGTVTVSDNS